MTDPNTVVLFCRPWNSHVKQVVVEVLTATRHPPHTTSSHYLHHQREAGQPRTILPGRLLSMCRTRLLSTWACRALRPAPLIADRHQTSTQRPTPWTPHPPTWVRGPQLTAAHHQDFPRHSLYLKVLPILPTQLP